MAENTLKLSEQDKTFIAETKNSSATKSVKFVKTPDIASSIDEKGNFAFEIPKFGENDKTKFVAEVLYSDYSSPTDYIWTGNLQEGGVLLFGRKNNNIVIFLQTPKKSFQIIPVNENVSIMTEINKDIIGTDVYDCGTSSETGELAPLGIDDCSGSINHCAAIVTVLVLLPKATKTALLSAANNNALVMQIILRLGFEVSNAALKNSGITGKEMKFIFDNTNFSSKAIFIDNALSQFETDKYVKELQDKHNADLVYLLTTQDFDGGIGITSPFGNGSNHSYGLIELPALFAPTWTAAHELGHNFGAKHSRDDKSAVNSSDCHHGWFIDKSNQTAVATWKPGMLRQMYYSNPDISFNGLPTGSLLDFNASIISNTFCDVAKYKDSDCNVLEAAIDGSSFVCIFENVLKYGNFTAQILGKDCHGKVIKYEWRTNTTGIFNTANSVIGTGSSLSFNSGILGNNFLFVTITTADGFVSTVTKRVSVLKCGPTHSKVSNNVTPNSINISQKDGLHVINFNSTSDDCKYQVSDINGRILVQKKIGKTVTYIDETIEINNNGIFFISIWNNGEILTKKIIVNN